MHSFTDSGFKSCPRTETKETDKHYNNVNTGRKVLWLVHLGRNKEFWTPFTHIYSVSTLQTLCPKQML